MLARLGAERLEDEAEKELEKTAQKKRRSSSASEGTPNARSKKPKGREIASGSEFETFPGAEE